MRSVSAKPMMCTLAIFGLLAACKDDPPTPIPGKCSVRVEGQTYIGQIAPLTGSLSSFGATIDRSAVLAVDEIRTAGGVKGNSLGLITCDDGTNPDGSVTAFNELTKGWSVSAIIGPETSSSVLAVAGPAASAHKVIVSPSATSPAVTGIADDGYVFRTAASDKYQGVVAAAIAKGAGLTKVFVINRNDAYGNGLRAAFIEAFTSAPNAGQASYTTYEESTLDGAAAIASAQAYISDATDGVFMVSFVEDGVAILKAAIAASFHPTWLLPDGPKDPELVTKVNDLAYLTQKPFLGTAPGTPKGADFDAFALRYQAKWGEKPNVFNGNGYDAVYLAAMAMQLSGNALDGTQVRDQLAHTKAGDVIHPNEWATFLTKVGAGATGVDYAGASGPVDFDANGDVISDFEQWTIEAGTGTIKAVGCWTAQGTPCT